MKLLKKSIVNLDNKLAVYDLEVDSKIPNFCLSNGIVVHNSKDISDAVVGAVFSCYLDIDHAGQLSNKYKLSTHADLIKERSQDPNDRFQEMVGNLY